MRRRRGGWRGGGGGTLIPALGSGGRRRGLLLRLLLLLLLGRRRTRRRLRHAHVRLHRRGVMGLARLGRAGLRLSVRRRRELHPLVAAAHVLLILVGGRT